MTQPTTRRSVVSTGRRNRFEFGLRREARDGRQPNGLPFPAAEIAARLGISMCIAFGCWRHAG